MGRRGQILWIRGLTRLQHQVSALACQESLLIRPSDHHAKLHSLVPQHACLGCVAATFQIIILVSLLK
jgi:hypothetical protein